MSAKRTLRKGDRALVMGADYSVLSALQGRIGKVHGIDSHGFYGLVFDNGDCWTFSRDQLRALPRRQS